jgi:hypothetical protein
MAMVHSEISRFIKTLDPKTDPSVIWAQVHDTLPKMAKWIADSKVAQIQMGNLEATKENLLGPEELRKQAGTVEDLLRLQIKEQQKTNEHFIEAAKKAELSEDSGFNMLTGWIPGNKFWDTYDVRKQYPGMAPH